MTGTGARRADWQDQLERLVSAASTPGAVLAVLDGDEVMEYAAGVANLETGSAMTADTLFPIASITKVVTATLLMQLVDEGRVDLDQPVRSYLPDFSVADPEVTKTLTVRHLLTHTGGIDGDKEDAYGRGDDAVARYVAACSELGQIHPPGTTFSYCNSGFIVLGHLVAALRGELWDDVVREHLFDPLGMVRSGTLPEHVIHHRVAAGHQTGDDGKPEMLDEWECERSHGPVGGVVSTARELLSFARLHLDGGRTGAGARVLSESSVALMLTPQVELPNPYEGETHWGLGWELTRQEGQPDLFGHGGDLLGYHARLVVCPDRGLALVLLTNGDGTDTIETAFFGDALGQVGVRRPVPPSPPSDAPSVDLPDLAGTYQTVAVQTILTAAGDHLDATFRIIAPRILALLPSSQHEQHSTLHPVTSSLFVTREEDDEPWTPVVFFDSDNERYLHMGLRAFKRVRRQE